MLATPLSEGFVGLSSSMPLLAIRCCRREERRPVVDARGRGGDAVAEFFCLSCQLVHKALLPEAKAKRCFFSRGWVLTMGKEGELHMLKNPMSCRDHIIQLPNLNKFLAIQNSRLLRTGCFVILNRGGIILRFDADGPTPLEAQVVFKMPRGLLGREPDVSSAISDRISIVGVTTGTTNA
ncbi:hypothetical protein ACJRO7_030010 [Eucalyptus globulus]|uniref:Uncharacterized protein n=1 Tax=Eucalyptus globulus TaxID=34317 RepID=A0ABD3JD65_EUCGL